MLQLAPRKTALVLIDLQKGILGMPTAPHAPAQILANAALVATALKKAGGTIILVRVAFSANYADKPNQATDVPMVVPPGGLPADWADFAPEIASLDADAVITKRQWSAFYGTELDLQLRRRGIDTVVLGGLMTNFGVESTARDGWQHNYAMVIAEDATSGFTAELHAFAIGHVLPRIARVRSTADIVASLHN